MTGQLDIRPIETTYRGYRFRSRLEARWAVFFDAMDFNWQYEPEGFRLPSGKFYLPDFRVMMCRDGECWFEIKPGDEGDNDLFSEFMDAMPGGNCVGAVLNDIPDPLYVRETGNYYRQKEDRPYMRWSGNGEYGGWDNYHRFCICTACGIPGFEFDGRSARIGCGCAIHAHSDRNHTSTHPKIIAAFAKARAARFEHNERESYA